MMYLPVGTILPYAGDIDARHKAELQSKGFLFCNGEAVDRDEYDALYHIMGDSYGRGDGVRTFNIPDLRGMFLRGVDGGRGMDPDAEKREGINGGNIGDRLGSVQSDELKKHSHYVSQRHHRSFKGEDGGGKCLEDCDGDVNWYTAEVGGNETRPKNVYVNYIIKAKEV